MPLNISAFAPGPGGTTMLGERGGLDAAAQRGLERQKREREEAAAREGKVLDDTMSGTTLALEDTKPEINEQYQQSRSNGELETKSAPHGDTTTDKSKGPAPKEGEGRWERLKNHFR
ncbi:hypothetical protein BGW36DRAFT_377440 [Talaromyces proteolyticus]|uniref:Uncharacterized protein n=1 Tax=Talaromyces proteolyticus TaxID=1131652 RepID=A0AAD4Q250_9EURO|nr:uncharacterized protein BGW36DRAFT_377440 [Talaromyces proteolyticus]KAH8699195.1 hypothetical protein BGW36DRAFT_377440 [Talaromyces proteolyticus]